MIFYVIIISYLFADWTPKTPHDSSESRGALILFYSKCGWLFCLFLILEVIKVGWQLTARQIGTKDARKCAGKEGVAAIVH